MQNNAVLACRQCMPPPLPCRACLHCSLAVHVWLRPGRCTKGAPNRCHCWLEQAARHFTSTLSALLAGCLQLRHGRPIKWHHCPEVPAA